VDEPLSSVRAALAGRYAIERELGRGGMATVYLAEDLKHRRAVAVKVLRPDVAASMGSERFLREIHTAARLQHPHILPLLDSGEAGGFLYYVMPHVEGESLRGRLEREPQLSLDDAIRIAREVADALSYAHAHDVVHRDIKPENILFSGRGDVGGGGGHALVTDFGIARAMSAGTGDTLTQAGMSVGTPSYMSPEQASAEPGIDGRSDEYALGCVLYEMLAGHPPFLGSTAQEILARHSLDPVPPLRTIRPQLPEFVERAVGKALAKAPADRFPTAAAFSTALAQPGAPRGRARQATRRAVLVASGVAVLGVGYAVYRSVRPPIDRGASASADAAPSIAVLAFANVGGDSTNEPFSDGIADELTTALGKVEGLTVTARTSAFSFKGKDLEPREIGRRLRVRYLVEGSVRRVENRRRVNAQLIDIESGKELWSDKFDNDALNRDVFAVQDSITRSIVEKLRVKLSVGTRALLATRSTGSPEAHELYLQGRYFFAKRDGASLKRAQDYFEQAIDKDSSYALAYAGLSDAYSHRSVFGYALPRASFPKAKEYALRALALDSTLVEAHTSMAFIALFYDWDWGAAAREFDRALALDPRHPPAHLYHGWYFVATDRMNDAVEEFRAAVRLDPFSNVNNTRLATGLFYAHRYDEALVQARRILELDPGFFQGRMELARPLLELNRCAESLDALAHSPENLASSTRGAVGYTYAKCGRREQALAELEHLRAERRAGRYVSHYAIAMIYAGLRDAGRAFAALDSAFDERAWPMFVLKREPAFDPLRSDPRFAHVLERVGLAR
jgi:eukaryotic-like serine/threonine-protein kinase